LQIPASSAGTIKPIRSHLAREARDYSKKPIYPHGMCEYCGQWTSADRPSLAGVAKNTRPKPFIAQMNEFGVPAVLLLAVIALEIGAGLAIALLASS
jgi:hypothetical protein